MVLPLTIDCINFLCSFKEVSSSFLIRSSISSLAFADCNVAPPKAPSSVPNTRNLAFNLAIFTSALVAAVAAASVDLRRLFTTSTILDLILYSSIFLAFILSASSLVISPLDKA